MFKFCIRKDWHSKTKNMSISDAVNSVCSRLKEKGDYFADLPIYLIIKQTRLFESTETKQHRYIAKKSVINKFLSANVDMDNIPTISARFIHFEKGCFSVGDDNILGAMFFCDDGNIYMSATVELNGAIESIYYSVTANEIKDYKGFDLDHLETVDAGNTERDIAKVCFVSALAEASGLSEVKNGLWRNRFKHNGQATVLQYKEPKRKVAWHFRQLRADRYYRGEHENKERGSRWIFVCPDGDNNIETHIS